MSHLKAAQELAAALDQVGERAEANGKKVEESLSRLDKLREEHERKFEQGMVQLQEIIDTYGTMWGPELQLQLDALDAGAIRLDQFLAKVGDWRVQTEEGVQQITELFEGADFKGRADEIQSLIQELRRGTIDTGELVDRLGQMQGRFAQELREVIQAVTDGIYPIERLSNLVRQIEKNFPGSDLGNLAKTAENLARQGKL